MQLEIAQRRGSLGASGGGWKGWAWFGRGFLRRGGGWWWLEAVRRWKHPDSARVVFAGHNCDDEGRSQIRVFQHEKAPTHTARTSQA